MGDGAQGDSEAGVWDSEPAPGCPEEMAVPRVCHGRRVGPVPSWDSVAGSRWELSVESAGQFCPVISAVHCTPQEQWRPGCRME